MWGAQCYYIQQGFISDVNGVRIKVTLHEIGFVHIVADLIHTKCDTSIELKFIHSFHHLICVLSLSAFPPSLVQKTFFAAGSLSSILWAHEVAPALGQCVSCQSWARTTVIATGCRRASRRFGPALMWASGDELVGMLHTITDPWFVRWLDYPASHLVRNIRNMRCKDRAASLFSGEHVLFQGIYVVVLQVARDKYDGINVFRY